MIGLSIVLYFVFILIYDVVTYTSSFHTVYTLIATQYFYFCILATISLVCITDLGFDFAYSIMFPNDSYSLASGCIAYRNSTKKSQNNDTHYHNETSKVSNNENLYENNSASHKINERSIPIIETGSLYTVNMNKVASLVT